MPEKIPANSRATATLDVTIFYDGGRDDEVSVALSEKPYSPRFSVPRSRLSDIRAPIQQPGERIWHSAIESEFEVVLHDPEGRQYVLRNLQTRLLFTVPDNRDVIPMAEWRKLSAKDDEPAEAPEPAPAVEIVEEAPAPPDGWDPPSMRRPTGTDLGAEDVL